MRPIVVMLTPLRTLCYSALILFLTATALPQSTVPNTDEIVVNQNRTPAGKLENGILTLQLEIRGGVWHPEAEDGPQLFVQAFGEVGRPAQIPAPLIRIPEGTTVHVTIINRLQKTATVYGLNTRPGDPKAGVEVAAAQSRELTFSAGAPGTYYYWAWVGEPYKTDSGKIIEQPLLADAYLNGGFIVDGAGPVPRDRVFVLNAMVALADVAHESFEVVTINGKSYPYTEPLEYTEGETVRWRVINPSFGEHPMHLHGAFYQLLSLGSSESDESYAEGERQSVVTQNLRKGQTMMIEWKPEHVGRWLFHCHFQKHISSEERVPTITRVSGSPPRLPPPQPGGHGQASAMTAMNDMAGLVLSITVNSAPGPERTHAPRPAPRKIDLVIAPLTTDLKVTTDPEVKRDVPAKSPAFSCSVREGKKIVVSDESMAMGPPIVVTRGEPVEITVRNHLREPTAIHWHGLELDSYYDGVIGGGTANQVTPAIAPGASFTARFMPNRAGTFIYHTHASDPNQLSGGVYGALIVVEPGESFDTEHDKLLVLGSRDLSFYATRITINGIEDPSPLMLEHGVKYRLRLINIAPNLAATFQLGSPDHPATWRALAKDGAQLPARLAKTSDATLQIDSGEAYDFEFEPDAPGEIPLQVENRVNKAKRLDKFVVQ